MSGRLSRHLHRRKTPTPEQVAATLTYSSLAEIAQLVRSPDLPQGSVRRRLKHLSEVVASTVRGMDGACPSLFDNRTWNEYRTLCTPNPFVSGGRQPKRLIDEIELHVGGGDAIKAVLARIREAQFSIRIWMFMWSDDPTGNEVASALLDAAERGVKIIIHKDQCAVMFERGSGSGQSMFHKGLVRIRDMVGATLMRWAYPEGAPAKRVKQQPNSLADRLAAHPNVKIESRARYDHSKVYIFDGETIILGGVNISDTSRHDFHDYMAEVRSKLLVGRFLSRLEGREQSDVPLGASVDFFFNVVRKIRGRKREVGAVMQHLLDSAQREIIIQMAYFGDKRLTNAIVAAAQRGVQVAILTSEYADVQNDLNYKILRDILQRSPAHSVRIYLSRATHAKVLHVDRARTFLGSANMNTTGTVKLGEANLYVNDGDGSSGSPQSPFTARLREQLLKDMRDSKRVVSPHQLKMKPIRAWLESRVAA